MINLQTVHILLVVAYASAAQSAMFTQDGSIASSADTNTQEDFTAFTRAGSNSSATTPSLNVFILPHSHDDPGWVRTSDQYFDFFVRHIYTTVVEALAADKSRKFQAVEMIYFHQWWQQASVQQQVSARRLIHNGQLSFAVGGWVMPDEATTDYADLIETMTAGHRFIEAEFGVSPKHGFQVDPFGASSWWALLSAKMGFEAHIVARLNYYDKGWMQANKALEFIWRPSAELHEQADLQIFTHIMDQYQYSSPGIPTDLQKEQFCAPPHNRNYCPGGGFFWDGDDSHPASYWTEQQTKQGFSVYPGVNDSNVQFYADFIVQNAKERADWFATPNVLWSFGTDFQHFNASEMFKSMDKIIQHVDHHNGRLQRYAGVKLQYASLSDYFNAVHATNQSWPVRGSGDFLPYSTLNCAGALQSFNGTCSGNAGPQYEHSWPQTWSGFYTSHMPLKMATRNHGQRLRAAESLLAQSACKHSLRSEQSVKALSAVGPLRSAVGLLPHHDAISGTMGPGCGNSWVGTSHDSCPALPMGNPANYGAVANDYLQRLNSGWQNMSIALEDAAAALLSSEGFGLDAQQFFSALEQGQTASAAIFNPLGTRLERWVDLHVPVNHVAYEVRQNGKHVPSELLSATPRCSDYKTECEHQSTDQKGLSLYVRVSVPPQGFQVLSVYPLGSSNTTDHSCKIPVAHRVRNGQISVTTPLWSVQFNDGKASTITDRAAGTTMQISEQLAAYSSYSAYKNYSSTSSSGNTTTTSWSLGYTGARSGSYLLHPGQPEPKLLAHPRLSVLKGCNGHITEIHEQYTMNKLVVWRFFHDDAPTAGGFIELETTVGPLVPNEEQVMLFTTDLHTADNQGRSIFFSDNNGAMVLQRVYSPERLFPDGTRQLIAPDDTYNVALNYHPLVRSAFVRDIQTADNNTPRQLTLLVPQTGAITSRSNGELEWMMLRRSAQDDSKGACQVFNDTSGEYANIPMDPSAGVNCSGWLVAGTCRPDGCPEFAIPMNISARVKLQAWLIAGATRTSAARRRDLSQAQNNPPLLFFKGTESNIQSLAPMGQVGLPKGVHLLTLRVENSSAMLLRLHHTHDGDGRSEPIRIKFASAGLCGLLGEHSTVTETSISTLQPLAKAGTPDRLQHAWKADERNSINQLGSSGSMRQAAEESTHYPKQASRHSAGRRIQSLSCHAVTISILPQDIRTFLIT